MTRVTDRLLVTLSAFGEFEPKSHINEKKLAVIPKAEKEPAKKAH